MFRPVRPPTSRLQNLMVLIVILWLGGTTLLAPFFDCGECRGYIFQERLRQARAPGIAPDHAAAIRSHAYSDECRRCTAGRKSLFHILCY